MATVARESIGLLNDKITIKLTKEDYLPVYEKKLKEYSKTMNVPGFRKGMVPTGVVKRMYGASIYTDEVLKTVEKELMGFLQTEQPDIFAQPMALESGIKGFDHNQPADYEFDFEIGLKPDFAIAPLANATVTLHKVKVTDEMVQLEVDRMLVKAGSAEALDVIEDVDNAVTILFTEADDARTPAEGGIVGEATSPFKDLTPAVQDELKATAIGTSIVKQLKQCFEGEKLLAVAEEIGLDATDKTGTEKYFQLTVTTVKRIKKSELNEEFYKKIFPGTDIVTEEAFRAKLKEQIQQYWDAQSRNQLHDQLYHYLLDNTQMEFPASFLKRWMQFNGEKPKTAEQVEEEFPTFSGQLKWTLINDKIIKDNSLDVSGEDLQAAMKAEVLQYFGGMSMGGDLSWIDGYVDRMMKDEKQAEATYRRLLTEKLFNWAESQVTPAEKEVTAEELTGMQHHHH